MTTARRCALLLIRNMTFEINSSFDGKFESDFDILDVDGAAFDEPLP